MDLLPLVLVVIFDRRLLLDINNWLDERLDPLGNRELVLMMFRMLLVPFRASEIRLCILDFKLLSKLLGIEYVKFSSMAYTLTDELKTDNAAREIMVTYSIVSIFIISNGLVLYYFLENISKSPHNLNYKY
jgi:predicted cation transporter